MNKSDIMKAAELSYEERVEAVAVALYNDNLDEEHHITTEDWNDVDDEDKHYFEPLAKIALKAAGIDQLLKAAELLKQVDIDSGLGDDAWFARARGALTHKRIAIATIGRRIAALKGVKNVDKVELQLQNSIRKKEAKAKNIEAKALQQQTSKALEIEKNKSKLLHIIERTDYGSCFINAAYELCPELVQNLHILAADKMKKRINNLIDLTTPAHGG